MKFTINQLLLTHTPSAPKAHYWRGAEALLPLVERNWNLREQGYRDGVFLVPVLGGDAPDTTTDGERRNLSGTFFTALIKLKDGQGLTGRFEARVPGEEPRKHVRAHGAKELADWAKVVVYRGDLATEGGDPNSWELVTLLAGIKGSPESMPPETLCYNHFELSGGTATKMDPLQFQEALRKSFTEWRNWAMVDP